MTLSYKCAACLRREETCRAKAEEGERRRGDLRRGHREKGGGGLHLQSPVSVASHEDSDDGVEDEEYEDEDDNDAVRMRCCQHGDEVC